jgi:hypothetical protein
MISSNPHHPLWPTIGITHTWMGESWMGDEETSVMMMAMISSKSPSRQGARTEFLVLNHGFWWWRRSGTLSRKNAKPPMFSGQRVYVGGRRGQCDGWGSHTTPCRGLPWPAPHHPLTRPGLARATRWCEPLMAPLCLIFWLRESSGKIGVFRYFPGFFLKVGFLHKNETPEQFC